MCVILHMSIITQYGRSALTLAAMWGETEVVVQLVKAGANVDMQTNVCQYIHTQYWSQPFSDSLSCDLHDNWSTIAFVFCCDHFCEQYIHVHACEYALHVYIL